MVDERLFEFLVARLQTRESSSLTLATLASSISLVLLAINFQNNTLPSIPVIFMGFLFPLIAFAYNEVTARTIHKHDQSLVREMILSVTDEQKKDEVRKKIVYANFRDVRGLLSRLLLLSPLLGWSLVLSPPYNVIIFISVIISILVITVKDKIK